MGLTVGAGKLNGIPRRAARSPSHDSAPRGIGGVPPPRGSDLRSVGADRIAALAVLIGARAPLPGRGGGLDRLAGGGGPGIIFRSGSALLILSEGLQQIA